MRDEGKTKHQLIDELKHVRQRVIELEQLETWRKRAKEAVRERENKYRTLLENLPQKIFFKDKNSVFISCNENYARDLNIKADEIAGKTDYDFFPRELAEKYRADDKRIMASGKTEDIEEEYIQGGQRVFVHTSKTPVKRKNGALVGILGIFWDITERKRAEEEIRRLTSAVEQSIDGIAMWDLEPRLVYVNGAFARMHGYTPEEMIGMNVLNLHNEEQVDDLKRGIDQIRTQGSWAGEIGHIKKDGTPFPTYMSVTLLKDDGGRPTGILAVARDITERKQAEEKLLAYQRQLRSLASELSLTQERERRRIATELHDSIGHALALSKIKLGELRESLSSAAHIAHMNEVYELMEQAIQSTRSLTFELSPPVLHELGLKAAVEWIAEGMQRKYGILTHVEDDGKPMPLDDDVQIILFQATRELLVNAIKHAQARNARVSILMDCEDIRISVEDDGVGFDPSKLVSSTNSTGGLGFFNIRERLYHIQGNLEIQSESGRGTRVTMLVPLNAKREDTNGRLP